MLVHDFRHETFVRATILVVAFRPLRLSYEKTMQAWGLINQVLPDAEVDAKARTYAMKLAHGPTVAFGISKSLINMTVNHGVSAADALVVDAAPQTLDTTDMQTAVKHYLEGGVEALLKGVPFKGK